MSYKSDKTESIERIGKSNNAYEHKVGKNGMKYMSPFRFNASQDVDSSRKTMAKKMAGKKAYDSMMKRKVLSKKEIDSGYQWKNVAPKRLK